MQAKSLFLAFALTSLRCFVQAQDTAPISLTGKSAVVVISSGTGNFATVGGYRISFSLTNATYTVSPLSMTVSPSAGTYSYSKTNSNTARITFIDPSVGGAVVQNLVFTSPVSATYTIPGSLGSQAGTLVLEALSGTSPVCAGLVNMSVRAQVLESSRVISGLVVDSPCRVLVRVAGPALTGFGVRGTLSNPKLALMAGNTTIIANDDWASTISNYDSVLDAGTKAGAFPFPFGSKDAAVVVDLTAGNYTCTISGDPGTSGEVLLEVYRLPQ
jgi:hypothetical protein